MDESIILRLGGWAPPVHGREGLPLHNAMVPRLDAPSRSLGALTRSGWGFHTHSLGEGGWHHDWPRSLSLTTTHDVSVDVLSSRY